MPRKLPSVLEALAAVLLSGAALLLLLPTSTTVAPAHLRLPATSPTSPSLTPPDSAGLAPYGAPQREAGIARERIVATNLFSASRHPPRVPFVAQGDPYGSTMAPDTDAEIAAPGAGSGPQVTLEGIVVRDGQSFALIRLDRPDIEQTTPPRLLRTGDSIGGFRVRGIGRDHVVLTSAGGVRTLRLQRQLPSDSSAPRQ